MRAWLVVAVLCLAGCTTPEATTREDQFFANVTTSGEWVVRLPMPADAWSADTWQELVRVSLGNATIEWVDGELPLEVHGNGTVRLEALARWADPDPLLDVNQAIWTTGDMDGGATRVEVLEGHIDTMRMEHTALICRGPGCNEAGEAHETCFTEVRFFVSELGIGSHDVGVQPVSRTCVE